MARPLRIQFENAHYHVTCRGNSRQDIFANDEDYRSFTELLARSSDIYQVEIFVYVLMRNHFHLLVKTPKANLQEFMRHFNISYTSHYNRTHRRSGHLFQGRYKSFLIDADSYLLSVSRYIHLNPVRVADLRDYALPEKRKHLHSYPWSSYSGYVYGDKQSSFICYKILEAFGGNTAEGRSDYARFVEAGLTKDLESPLERGRGHGIVGDEQFMQHVKLLAPPVPRSREVPGVRHVSKVDVEKVVQVVERHTGTDRRDFLGKAYRGLARPILMELLYRHTGLNQQEIGKLMGVDYSTVSVSRKRLHVSLQTDEKLYEILAGIKVELNDGSGQENKLVVHGR
jgi:putative transposase